MCIREAARSRALPRPPVFLATQVRLHPGPPGPVPSHLITPSAPQGTQSHALPSSLLKTLWCSGSTVDTRCFLSLIFSPRSHSTAQFSVGSVLCVHLWVGLRGQLALQPRGHMPCISVVTSVSESDPEFEKAVDQGLFVLPAELWGWELVSTRGAVGRNRLCCDGPSLVLAPTE